MCGIVGYSGKAGSLDVLLEGLHKLEYRGYDSAGVALSYPDGIRVAKAQGRLSAWRKSWPGFICRTAAAASAIPAGPPTARPVM